MSKGVSQYQITLSIQPSPESHRDPAIRLQSFQTSALDSAVDYQNQTLGLNSHLADPIAVSNSPASSRIVYTYHCQTCSAFILIPTDGQGELKLSALHKHFLESHQAPNRCELQLLTNQVPKATTLSAPKAPSHQTVGHLHQTPKATTLSPCAPKVPSHQTVGHLHQAPKATTLSPCAPKAPSQIVGHWHQAHTSTPQPSTWNKQKNSRLAGKLVSGSATAKKATSGSSLAKKATGNPSSAHLPQARHQGYRGNLQYPQGTAIQGIVQASQGSIQITPPTGVVNSILLAQPQGI
jgi:hypothetical protein